MTRNPVAFNLRLQSCAYPSGVPEILVTGKLFLARVSNRALVVRLTNGSTQMKNMMLRHIGEQVLSETTRQECNVESLQLMHQLKSCRR